MLHLDISQRYFLYQGHTDMRKGFDSLSGMIAALMQQDPYRGDIYVFFNRRRNQVKLLHWEGDGYAMYYKRLEKGTYENPMSVDNSNAKSMPWQELQFILQGISLQKNRYRLRYKKTA